MVLRNDHRHVHMYKWMVKDVAVKMDEHSENDSESTSSGSPSANTAEETEFYFKSSTRGQPGLPSSKRDLSAGVSSSEEDDDGEGEKHSDSSSTSSDGSNVDNVSKGKSLVTTSTAPSDVDKAVLMGNPPAMRSSLRSSSSIGGEGESPQHDSEDDEFGASFTRKRQASDGSSSPPPPSKRTSHAHVEYSDFAQRMMAQMGHTAGRGLGRRGQGIIDPVKESVQMGRAGLGAARIEELEASDIQWEQEEISCEENPEWMKPTSQDPPTDDAMLSWMRVGPRKKTIADETMFCDPDILSKILSNKTVFDNLDRKIFLDARERSNPFEIIKGVIFQNRAAMKMANIDAVFDFMFSHPKSKDGHSIIGPNDLLYFADICAGPGGFTEYMLYRTKWHAKGYGFTLKDPPDGSDFKLHEFHASDCETFEPYYGVHGDGDITNTENLLSLQEHVFKGTEGQGVHFVMGDGGISVEGEENIQELLTKQLVMCQFACALSILRHGGHFVCKLFDAYTPFIIGLIYLLHRSFESVCLFKPVTSRPANSERYVVCKGYIDSDRNVSRYLLDVNDRLNELSGTDEDVLEVVPLSILENDDDFMDYVYGSNNSIGEQQCVGLIKLQYFIKNRNLLDKRQADIKDECLKLWKIPNNIRTTRKEPKHDVVLSEFWKKVSGSVEDYELLQLKTLTPDNLPQDVHTWKWYFACGIRYLVVGTGRSQVKGWNMRGIGPHPKPSLGTVPGLNIDLPPQTILDIEVVEEFTPRKRQVVVYVVDVIAISGEYMGDQPFPERQAMITKLAKAVNKLGKIPLKLKQCHRVIELERSFSSLEDQGNSKIHTPIFYVDKEGDTFVQPKGIILFKTLKDPWHLHHSKSSRRLYFYNQNTRQSVFETPQGSVAAYRDFLRTRMLWLWGPSQFSEILGLTQEQSAPAQGTMSRQLLTNHILKHSNL